MIKLDPWQQQVLDCKTDVLLCTGRRGGKTYIFCRKAIEEMRDHPGIRIGLSSLTEEQAIFIINTMKVIAQELCPHLISKKKKMKPTLKTLPFSNGSIAFSRPVGNSGDSWRGYELDVIYTDEASRMPRFYWTAVLPTIMTTGGRSWMASTPFGKQGYFWERFDEAYNKHDPKARYTVIYKNSEEIINEREISEEWTQERKDAALKVLADDKKDMSKIEYGQEYLGLFLDELQRFIDDDLIDKACIMEKNPSSGGTRYLGVDIGRMYDPSAFEDITVIGNKIYQVDSQTTTKTLTTETQNKIIEMDNAVHYKKIGIDAGSGALGVGVFDNLLLTSVGGRLVPMNNRAIALDREGKKKQGILKTDFYLYFKGLLENGNLKLLKDDSVIASLRSLQWEIVEGTDKTSQIRVFGNNTHIAEGLIRAVWLTKEKSLNLWVEYN